MKVLLVYPEFPDTFWSFKHALPFQGKRSAFPPLGLLTVSAMLPKHWQKRLVDLNVRAPEGFGPGLGGRGFLQRDDRAGSFHEGADLRAPSAAAGGRSSAGRLPAPSDAAISQADHIVEGEAEEMIGQLAADLEQGTAKPHYMRAQLPDVTRVPLPDLHLAPLRRYSSMSVQFSRGCPFTCEFCDIIEIYGRRPRTKTPEQVCAELDQLYRLGWRGSVFMVDDNFIGNKKSVKALLPRLVQWMRDHKFPLRALHGGFPESGGRRRAAGR